jgi:hypothetical protein
VSVCSDLVWFRWAIGSVHFRTAVYTSFSVLSGFIGSFSPLFIRLVGVLRCVGTSYSFFFISHLGIFGPSIFVWYDKIAVSATT